MLMKTGWQSGPFRQTSNAALLERLRRPFRRVIAFTLGSLLIADLGLNWRKLTAGP
jgi:hypothetical protein